MANHFRSSERQGDDRLDSTSPQVPQADAFQGDGSIDPQSHVDAIAREEAANVRNTAAHAAPVAQAPADPTPQAPAGAEPLQPVTTVTAHTPEDAPQAPRGEGLVVSQTAGDIESQPETKSVFAPLQDDGNRVVPHTGRPTISLRNATLIYPAQPNKPALDGVSLDIYPGEFVFVVGHSGSGKSTLLKLLTRELRATSGKVIVAGQDLTKLRDRKVPYLRRQIGTVYQDFKLLPDKTVYENVAFALECIGKPRAVIKVQVPETLRLVGLAEKMDNYPDQLSGGEQQRVSVARAMVNRPPLLVCDEPTGNLDPAISLGIMRLLDRINRTGTTVVMATHDREMVDSMRRRVIALEAGHVVRDQEKGGYGFYGAI
ncbi:cell division ATP-binding protein FtsE [Parafannyhessea umbonata]|uniref:cell division ATP-binding protein FtsE n=1 Tax=Parafannyhessea umbonata TaxID=604330 RepID=UPI003F9DB371